MITLNVNTSAHDTAGITKKYKQTSQSAEVWRRLRRNKAAMLGLVVAILLILMAVFSSTLYDYETQVINQDIPNRLQPPSWAHPFGTDESGRDILARIVYGSRFSLSIGFSTVVFALTVGGTLGALAGYYGGWLDNILMRVMDIFLAIPGTLFAITLVAALGQNTINLIIALAISSVPGFARILRSSVLSVREVEYVEAARAIGATDSRIILQHVIPNSLAPVIVQSTLNVATVILTIAGLSFLGLGVRPPQPEWGALLSSGRQYLRDYGYITMFPGLAIMTTILALNLLGDGLRDALDPRLK